MVAMQRQPEERQEPEQEMAVAVPMATERLMQLQGLHPAVAVVEEAKELQHQKPEQREESPLPGRPDI